MPVTTHKTNTRIPRVGTDALASRLMSLEAAAAYLGISEKSVRRRISEGSLPAYRMGPRHIRVRLEDVDALLRPIPTGGAAS